MKNKNQGVSTPFFQTAEFKAQNKIWKAKLVDSGFVDVEDRYERLTSYSRIKYNGVRFDSTEEYYRRATHFKNDYESFTNDEAEIWKLHADGYTVRSIVKATGINHSQVQRTIERLRKAMFELYKIQGSKAP